jgi:hypothetical protein
MPPEERVRAYQVVREAGVLPADAGFFLLALPMEWLSADPAFSDLHRVKEEEVGRECWENGGRGRTPARITPLGVKLSTPAARGRRGLPGPPGRVAGRGRPVDVTEVAEGHAGTLDHAQHPTALGPSDHGQYRHVVLHEQLHRPVQPVVGLEGGTARIRSAARTRGARSGAWEARWTSSRLTTPSRPPSASSTGRVG